MTVFKERLKKFKLEAFTAVVKASGKLTSKQHGDARINVCRTLQDGEPCNFRGMVEPFPDLVLEGCLICGCPFATKPYMIHGLGKKVECPHPEGNKWKEIDKQFLDKNN